METTETDIFNIFDFPIQHFPDRRARWLLQDKENVRGLILHRRPIEEHAGLITILNQHAPELEVDTMAEVMADTLLEQGIEQGIEQGETRAKRDAVLKVLRSRFGSVPDTLITQINTIQNLAELDALFEEVLDAKTVDDIHLPNRDT